MENLIKTFTLEEGNFKTDKDREYSKEELLSYISNIISDYFIDLNNYYHDNNLDFEVILNDLVLGKDKQSIDAFYSKIHKKRS